MGHDQELEGSAIPPFIFLYSPLKSSLNLLFSGVLNLLHFKHWLKWFAFSLYPFHFSYTVPLRFLAKLGNFAFRSLKNGNVCFFSWNIWEKGENLLKKYKIFAKKKIAKVTKCKRKFSNVFSKVFVRHGNPKNL